MKHNSNDKTCKDGVVRPVESVTVSSPIGNMIIRACAKGLHMINQVDDISDENFHPMPQKSIELLDKQPSDKGINEVLNASIVWLKTYFFSPEEILYTKLPSFCSVEEEGAYRDHVQLTLAKNVGFGQVVSYKELAALTRSPGATQAVGSAMRNNPFQLMVPCHRVINSGAKMGAYSGGRRNSTKEWLLRHEGLQVSNGIVNQNNKCK